MAPRSHFALIAGLGLQLIAAHAHAQASPAPSDNSIKDIKEVLTDTAAGHVSASSIVGIAADAVAVVENPRSLVAALKGLGSSGSQVAIAITPARTSLLPMNLSTYADGGVGARLLGNATISYAQGTAKTTGIDLERRAVSLETSITLNADQDPVIAVGKSCKWVPGLAPPGGAGAVSEPKTEPVGAAGGTTTEQVGATSGATLDPVSAGNANYLQCVTKLQTALAKKWNVSRFSLSAGTAWIKSDTMSNTHAGHTVAASLIYGFDHLGMKLLSEGAALAVTVRHSNREPVLQDFAAGAVNRRSSTLAALRLSGGTEIWRGLAEISNARSSDTTATNDVFKHALGLDVRVAEGTWINLRLGKHRKSSGEGTETKSLMNLSFSPKANLL